MKIKDYISGPLERELTNKGVTLITGVKNIKFKVIKLWNRLMIRKRFIIETGLDQLKTYSKSSILGIVVVSAL
nr:transposase [Candidatus Enterovibrio escacola]